MTAKDPNRPPRDAGPDSDESLPRANILRGSRNFQRLFEKSTVLNSTTNSLQFRYRLYENPAEGCYIGFLAPKKKIGNAVKRNRIKRLLREVYRTRQHYLQDLFSENSFGFHGAFLAQRPDLSFADIKAEMTPLLETARQRLLDKYFKSQSPSRSHLPGKS